MFAETTTWQFNASVPELVHSQFLNDSSVIPLEVSPYIMEATEHSRFVGVTIEWKDAVDATGAKTSPDALHISVTAPFEQVLPMSGFL